MNNSSEAILKEVSVPKVKHRVWMRIQQSNPDGTLASNADQDYELSLNPLNASVLRIQIALAVKAARQAEIKWDRHHGRKHSSRGSRKPV